MARYRPRFIEAHHRCGPRPFTVDWPRHQRPDGRAQQNVPASRPCPLMSPSEEFCSLMSPYAEVLPLGKTPMREFLRIGPNQGKQMRMLILLHLR